MEMQQMFERLLAGQEEIIADRTADQEQRKAKREADKEEMKADEKNTNKYWPDWRPSKKKERP
jgi:hypothetical protein